MTLREYDVAVLNALVDHPEWRRGQTYFNVLYDLDPDLANEVRGTEFDPFYNDSICPDFARWLYEKVDHG